MTRRIETIFDDLFPDDLPEFAAIADVWPDQAIMQMLGLVWDAYDRMRANQRFSELDFKKNYAQLERSLTDWHASEVAILWKERGDGFDSFIPQHEPWEFGSLTQRSARPPSGDVGFVLRQNRRHRWSLEAKVLSSPQDRSRYLGDLQKFTDGASAPNAAETALGAYLLMGDAPTLFDALKEDLEQELHLHPSFANRAHRHTGHVRTKQAGSTRFVCHHLVFSLS